MLPVTQSLRFSGRFTNGLAPSTTPTSETTPSRRYTVQMGQRRWWSLGLCRTRCSVNELTLFDARVGKLIDSARGVNSIAITGDILAMHPDSRKIRHGICIETVDSSNKHHTTTFITDAVVTPKRCLAMVRQHLEANDFLEKTAASKFRTRARRCLTAISETFT